MNLPELVKQAQDGNIDPLNVALAIKDLEEQLIAAKKILKPIIVDSLNKYPKSEALASGFKIKVQNKTTYDYSSCEDVVWNDCNEKLENIKSIMKERESFLRTLKEPYLLVTSEGEMVGTIMPAKVLPSEDFYVITKNGKS